MMRSRRQFRGTCLCVALLLLACCARSGRAAETMPGTDQLNLADGFFTRGMFDLAAREYESFLERYPDSAKADAAWFRLGESRRNLGDNTGAEKAFRTTFARYPDSAFRHRAGFARATLFLDIGRAKESVALFRSVLESKPPADIKAACLYYMGDAMQQTDDPAGAAKAFEEVRKTHKDSPFYPYALLKLAQLRLGTAEEPSAEARKKALALYSEARKSGDKRVQAEALFQSAEIHLHAEQFEQSAALYKELITNYADDKRAAEAKRQAAWAAHHAGRYADALRVATEVLSGKVKPEREVEWLYLKANCERQLLNNDEAVATYTALLAKPGPGPYHAAARYELALTAYQMGDFRRAVTEAGRVPETEELKCDVYWLLAESHAALKEDGDAIQYYKLIIRDFPDGETACEASYRLAYHLQARKAYTEAATYYGRVVSQCGKSKLVPRALFAAGYCYAAEDQHADAVREWDRLIREHGADSIVEDALFQKAMSEIRLKRDAAALASLESFVSRFPKSDLLTDALYWKGMMLRELKRPEEAIVALGAVLSAKPSAEMRQKAGFYHAMSLYDAKKYDEALDGMHALLGTSFQKELSVPLLQWMGDYAFQKEKWAKSIDAGNALVATGDEKAALVGWFIVGRGSRAAGDTKTAEKALSKALATSSPSRDTAEAALWLGDLRFRAKDFKEAQELYTKAAQLAHDPELQGIRTKAYAGLGRTAKLMSDDEAAARYFMSVAILYEDPELGPECLYEAGLAFDRAGKASSAADAFRELKQRYPNSEWTKRIPVKP